MARCGLVPFGLLFARASLLCQAASVSANNSSLPSDSHGGGDGANGGRLPDRVVPPTLPPLTLLGGGAPPPDDGTGGEQPFTLGSPPSVGVAPESPPERSFSILQRLVGRPALRSRPPPPPPPPPPQPTTVVPVAVFLEREGVDTRLFTPLHPTPRPTVQFRGQKVHATASSVDTHAVALEQLQRQVTEPPTLVVTVREGAEPSLTATITEGRLNERVSRLTDHRRTTDLAAVSISDAENEKPTEVVSGGLRDDTNINETVFTQKQNSETTLTSTGQGDLLQETELSNNHTSRNRASVRVRDSSINISAPRESPRDVDVTEAAPGSLVVRSQRTVRAAAQNPAYNPRAPETDSSGAPAGR